MRIQSSSLVYLVSLTIIVPSLTGTVKAFARDGRSKNHIAAKNETKPESKPVDANKNAKVFIYKQTGGFIGVNRKYERNLADMGSEERQKLEQLIADSGLLNDVKKESLTAASADMFEYDFTFRDGAKQHHVVYDDGTLPKSFRPLTQFCKDKMVDLPRR